MTAAAEGPWGFGGSELLNKLPGQRGLGLQSSEIEEFIRHKQGALGCKRWKAISAAKGCFVLKHTTAVDFRVAE
jgi:hypothetical protein